jgi:hypothetical protein
MGLVSKKSGRQPAGAPRREIAKAPGGTKLPIVRQTLHLGENTVKRLGVHCSLVGCNASREADRILSQWLKQHGKGRAIFDSPEERSDPVGVDDDDRPDAGGEATDSVPEAA